MKAFAIGGRLGFHFEGPIHLPDLVGKLHASEIPEPLEHSVLIRCHGAGPSLRAAPWHFYKGIPWKGMVIRDAAGRIAEIRFHAVFFRQFLFFRIVLLPLLWRLAAGNGGFYLLGTVFRYDAVTRVLFAEPGAGKTRFMLKQLLDPACRLIGDGSLLYLPGNGFLPVIDEIELRWKTVAELPWRKKLSPLQKFHLLMCHLLSLLTCRFISFNLTLMPGKMGIECESDSPAFRHTFSFVRKNGELEELDAPEVLTRVMAYLTEYHRHYLNIYDETPPYEKTQKNLAAFCAAYLKKKESLSS